MGSVRLQNVTKQFGPQIVLHDVTLDLHTGQIAALVGANGAGKTTLFKLISGELRPDLGTVTLSRGLEVGYLPQEPDVRSGLTLRAAVGEAFADLLALERRLLELSEQVAAEHDGPRAGELLAEYDRVRARFEAAGGYSFEQRLNEVLGGLGFAPSDYELPVSVLSGGQKCRAALAKLLLQDANFLLLDEPTNHLDIDAVRWLEKFLAGHHGGAVIISHDRYLLDRLAERTIEVVTERAGAAAAGATDAATVAGQRVGRVYSYPGNYTNYVQAREVRRLTQERQYEQDKAFIEKERDYIARYAAGGQRRGQIAGRRTRLARRLAAGEFTLSRPEDRRSARLEFADSSRKTAEGTELLRLEGLHKQYGEKVLFTGLDLTVYAGQRLGITGPNGTGKTTLLKIILDQVRPDSGRAYLNPAARIGYFAQETIGLDPERTIVQEIREIRPDFLDRDARHYAARFLFTGDEPFKRVGQLSGGEQSRVRFMKLILTAPDVLILDEPTNHLDIPAREALEEALFDFEGTVIAVSHDRYFLDRIVEKLLVMRAESVKLYPGNYSYYIAQVEQARAAEEAARAAAERTRREGAARAARSRSSGKPRPAAPRSPLARLTTAELETYIAEHEQKLAAVQERFGDAEVYRDPAALAQLRADYERLKTELTEAEEIWLEKVERE
ncbi:MAG: ABC-F family ATP-binding cassette domain-containing protein [Planctomycetota bacterium]